MTDTRITMGSMEAKYETTPGLSIGTMTFDLGWPCTVGVQIHQNYTSDISVMGLKAPCIGQIHVP